MYKFSATLPLIFIGAVAMALQACAPKPQESCNFVQNSYGQRVSWQKAPIVMYIDQTVPNLAVESIERAMESWNEGLGYEALKIGGVVKSSGPARDGSNVIYWLASWEENRPFEQARTTIHWLNTEIYEADIRVNAYNFRYSYSESPAPGHVDFESLILHELGHVLGLAHPHTNEPTVMNAYLQSGALRRLPQPVDFSSLSCEYKLSAEGA